MTRSDSDWVAYAARLVADLTDSGDLHDPAWAAALAATPRHRLVPTAYQQQDDGSWTKIDASTLGLALAYSPTTLVTEIDDRGHAVSSSTKPDLMVRMLETLDVHDGHRVLEVGTGSGYNVALLCHRLGAGNVFSIDVDADLVAKVRQRLAAIGCEAQLAGRDGIDGWPHHAPYDRIIATCSVPLVPWSWAQQLSVGGKLLADVKLGTGAGNLVLLHRYHDRLEGRFTRRWAAFMGMRHDGDTTLRRAPRAWPASPCPTTCAMATPSTRRPARPPRRVYPRRMAPGARSTSPPPATARGRSAKGDPPRSGKRLRVPTNAGASGTSRAGNASGSPSRPIPRSSGSIIPTTFSTGGELLGLGLDAGTAVTGFAECNGPSAATPQPASCWPPRPCPHSPPHRHQPGLTPLCSRVAQRQLGEGRHRVMRAVRELWLS